MSSAKSSRSRASGPSGPIPVVHAGGPDSGVGGGGGSSVQLTDKLKIFKTDNFDPDAYVQSKCQTMNEKEIRQLCGYLHELKKASAEEMRRSVYANYAAFIRTSKEISDLEGELLSIRNLLSTQAAVIHNLAEGVHVDSLSAKSDGFIVDDMSSVEDREPSDIEKWLVEFPDMLDVLLAERRVDEALEALDEAERISVDAKENKRMRSAEILSLQIAISNHRQKLADQLAEAACQSSTRGVELRTAASALKRLGDGHRAHSLILNAHNQRLKYNMQTIHPTSTSYGGAYTAALSQQVFSAIAQAVNDSLEVFGNESAYLSELVTWSTKQTEAFAQLVLRHALASSAAAGGLRAAAECVQIAIGHCSLLENRGLALSSVLMNLFKPSVELALGANLKRIEESTAALAAADDWVLVYPPSAPRTSNRTSSTASNLQPKLSSSAHRFNSMVQDFFEDVGPLLSMQLGGSTLNGLLKVFNSYVNLLKYALPGSVEDEETSEGSGNKIVRMAETEMQQLALLANASLLAEELLPRAAAKLSPMYQVSGIDEPRRKTSDRQNRMPEQREWKKKLQRSVDRLRDSFCRQHALDLIFTEDGETYLSADMYINRDNIDEPEWSPSLIFQELYAKLNRMSSIAADMFVGRERFATLLMMRLTETVILWLSEDQSFWEEIQEGPKPLSPQGLLQFYLDMQFVILFGQGRFLSRHVHQVIIDIIERVMAAFSANGGRNPDAELPPDEWFIDIAQETIIKISGKIRMANGEREVHSPTASVSAISVSSVRSHGSS